MKGASEDAGHRAASGCSHASSSDYTRPASKVSSQPLSVEAVAKATSTITKSTKIHDFVTFEFLNVNIFFYKTLN